MAFVEAGRHDEARRLVASWPGRRRQSGRASQGSGQDPEGDTADGDLDAAMRTLQHAAQASAALRSGRVDSLVAEARRAVEAVPDTIPWLVFMVGSLLQACYRFTGDPKLRALALETCARGADRTDLPDLAVRARGLMGNVHMMHGALHRAVALCDAALELAAAKGLEQTPAPAMALQFRGYVRFEWNRLDEAEADLRTAWELAGTSVGVRSGVARMMARLHSARGDDAEAEAWLERVESLAAEPMTLRNREWLAAVRVGQKLGPGQARALEAWLTTFDYRPEAVAGWTDARVLARLHELDQVIALLEATGQWTGVLAVAPRVATAARPERRWFAVRALTAWAVALQGSGRIEEADARMADALMVGRDGGFVRAFVEGSVVRTALLGRRAAGRGGGAGEVERAHEERAHEGVSDADTVRAEAGRVLAAAGERRAALTPTQTAVLRRVAAGASNKTVAREMGVSVSTVKTHLRAVYQRLEASSRTQAIARARDEGIL